MGAFKKMEGRYVWIDMTEIHVPSWKIRDVQKAAHAKLRALRRIDPFAKVAGCKKAYETAEELKAACDSYFKAQECYVYNKFGEPIRDPETGEYLKDTQPLTMSGLARHLGIQTGTLRRYRKTARSGLVRPEYAAVVLEAMQKIEEYAERRGYDRDGQKGSQFVLQAGFGWQTEREIRECAKMRAETEMAREKLKMMQEEHRMKMQMLKLSLEGGGEDNEVKITITRATREED